MNSNGKVPMIRFGPEFEEWDDARKISYLKKLASSMNSAAEMMQNERNQLAGEVAMLKEQVSNAEHALEIQKSIVMKNITETNAERQQNIQEISNLKVRIKAQDETIERLQPSE